MIAALGVNDHEIGAVIRRALDTPYVGGVSIQPQFGSGRSGAIDWSARLTHTGVLARLGPQTGGLVGWRDLTALPCSHPHCCSVGYLLRDDAGQWRSLTALIGADKLKSFLDLAPDLVANRIADVDLPDAMRLAVKESLLGLFSEQSSLSHPRVADLWRDICANCDLGVSTLATLVSSRLPGGTGRLRRLLGERIKRIVVKPFMDMATMIEERLAQCCVHVATAGTAARGDVDGLGLGSVQDDSVHQRAPFCAVQAWPALSRQRLAWAGQLIGTRPPVPGPGRSD
jgi:7,8-dihydro-6-hydroxymethylpterin dimethyltransferase